MILKSDMTQLTTLDQLSEVDESTNRTSQPTPSVTSVEELMESTSPKRKFSQMFEENFFATNDFTEPKLMKQAKPTALHVCPATENVGDYQCIDSFFNLEDDSASLSSPASQQTAKPLPIVQQNSLTLTTQEFRDSTSVFDQCFFKTPKQISVNKLYANLDRNMQESYFLEDLTL